MSPLITPALVRLDTPLGLPADADKHDVIRALADVVGSAGRAASVSTLAEDALTREATSPTGLPGGIAIPHCRTEGVSEPTLAFARLSPAKDFGAKDGPADLAFLIAAPAGGDNTHLQLLTKLARALVKKDFTDSLRAAATAEEVARIVANVVEDAPASAPAAPTPAAAPAAAAKRLVAVTSCPTGIAHTYMAAEALEAAATRAGVEISVETQGSAGSKPLPVAVIERADAVIFACDVGVRERGRFAGKPVVAAGVKRAIDEPDKMISEALACADDPSAPRVEAAAGQVSRHDTLEEKISLRIRRVLMTGVSYMIPFVAAGGLLIALAFLLGGYDIAGDPASEIMSSNTLFNLPDPSALGLEHVLFGSPLMAYLGAVLFTIGAAAFTFLVPALSGYIAFAIADRPGIAPGFVMGFLANSDSVQAGFLGGIVGGVLAGVIAHWLAQRAVPQWMRGLMPVVVIPLVTTAVAGTIMLVVLAKPLSSLMNALNDGLTNLAERPGLSILLGVLLGLMMAFDMGGPLNKTAYLFATTGLAGAAASSANEPQLQVMAAVMLAGMVPPLALALATVVRPGLFTEEERENGKAAWLLGFSFITEGAIPFAAADPLRVIPSIMLGSAVTGGLAMAMEVGLRAPHGGIFVLFAVIHIVAFLVALAAGVLAAAVAVIALKSAAKSGKAVNELADVAA